MKFALATALLALTLAGCSDNPDADGDGKISMDEAADSMEKNGGSIRPDPGLYRGTTELVNLEAPGAPPEAKKMLEAMLGGEPQVMEFCLTKEEADKGFERMAKGSQGDDCSFEKFNVSGGDIDAVMTCKGQGDGDARMVLKGKGTSTSSEMTMVIDAKGPDGQAMKMTMKTSQERIGDCKG